MNSLNLNFDNAKIPKKDLIQLGNKMKFLVSNLNNKKFNQVRKIVSTPTQEELEIIKNLVKSKNSLKPEAIVVVGIGGSNLGTLAIDEGVRRYFLNKKEIFYADTVDPESIKYILEKISFYIKNNKKIILNIVSKSGMTLETIANAEIFLKILKYNKNYKEMIIVTTDKGSVLWNWAKSNDIDSIEIPKEVPGRFSVFSAVGLLPLALSGLDINKLIEGKKLMENECLNPNILKNPAMISAAVQFHHYKNKLNITDLFMFSKSLESLGKWYRQLIAESLGKEYDLKGNKINSGVTPTYSIGTIDLHSIAQLYLAGPNDKLITFLEIEKSSYIKVPKKSSLEILNYINGKSLEEIREAIFDSVIKSFSEKNKPFIKIRLKELSEFYIAQFMQFKIFEVIFLGYLLNINSFDQPAIESYKNKSRKTLTK